MRSVLKSVLSGVTVYIVIQDL